MKRSDWISILAEIKIRLDRGNTLIYWFRNIIVIVAGLKYIMDLDMFFTIITGVILVFLLFILGWLDIDFIKIYQKEAELSTGKYNPYFRRLKSKV